MDQVAQIMAWEEGELNYDESLALFQNLVDTGLAWSLQGTYGRTAMSLLEMGLITLPDDARAELVAAVGRERRRAELIEVEEGGEAGL